MALVSSFELMKKAGALGRAVPAFNIDNLESALAVTGIIRESSYPAIIQMIPRTLAYGTVEVFPAMIKSLMEGCGTDYAIHLDHGSSAALCEKCIDAGFSSVMIDGSSLSFEENVFLTKSAVDIAHKSGVSVEGELGTIGGKEEGDTLLGIKYTEVGEAVEFIEKTGVDTLAIGVGTAHGVYKGTPVINTERIREIHAATDTPLVLHGASGLSNEILKECISSGITKINFATELRQAFTLALRAELKNDPDVFDPKLYMPAAIENIKNVLREKINICKNGE